MPTINLYDSNNYYDVLFANNHDDWLELRKKGIGGSDVSAILGLNPYMTNQELYYYKVGLKEKEDISDKPYVKYGHDAEPLLRGLFALDYPRFDVQYMENVVLANKTYPFIRYSPDGLIYDRETGMRGIYEGKTTNIVKSMHKEKWNNRVPDNYYCQVIQGFLVTGFDFVCLRAQLNFCNMDIDFENSLTERGGYKQIKDYIFYRTNNQIKADIQMVLNEEYRFYKNHIEKRVEPNLLLPMI